MPPDGEMTVTGIPISYSFFSEDSLSGEVTLQITKQPIMHFIGRDKITRLERRKKITSKINTEDV